MLRKTLLILGILPLIVLISSFTKEPNGAVLKTIIIDAGHGGIDPGAAGLKSTEAQICLEISKKLGEQIEREIPGVKVLYTRTTDVMAGNKTNKDEGLRYRADYANQSGADLFISIHCNSAGRAPGGWNERRVVSYDEKVTYVGTGKKKRRVVRRIPLYENIYVKNEVRGTETFIWTAKENSHKEQMVGLNEFSNEADSTLFVPENDPMIKALKLLYAKKYFAKSLQLAELIQEEFEKSGRVNRGVKQRNEKGIWVLHATGMPSILVETGFISNQEEEDFLLSYEGQSEVSTNITNAVKNYIAIAQNQQKNVTAGILPRIKNDNSTLEFLKAIEHKEHNH